MTDFSTASPSVLGIDIGGTNTSYALVDHDGSIRVRGCIPTRNHATFSEFIAALHREVISQLSARGIPTDAIAAIGAGAPCVNPSSGEIEGAVDLPWPSPLPLAKELSRHFGVPAAIENDANAAALGEMYYGAARGLTDFIMLTLGTGVGSGVVCDSHLLHGRHGLAAELGHTIIRRGGRECSCGRRGCLEMYASARGVVATARKFIESDFPSSRLASIKDLTPRDIYQAAMAGDPAACATWKFTGEILGEACAEFAAFSSPQAFIFFGGVARAFPLFKDAMKEAFDRNLLCIYNRTPDIRFIPSSLSDTDTALLGAAATGRNLI